MGEAPIILSQSVTEIKINAMKRKLIKKYVCLLGMLHLLFSCNLNSDFTIPQSLGVAENLGLEKLKNQLSNQEKEEISISNLKSLFVWGQAVEITSDIVIKGYVSSSDQSGNFYKELFIQDMPESPSSGIRIAIEMTNSYNKFNFGREVYIDLKGLFLGESRSGDGLISIGGSKNSDDEIENLSNNQIQKHMFRSTETFGLTPRELDITQIKREHIGMYVKAKNVQFPEDLLGKTYYDPNDSFDTQHRIESCMGFTNTTFILETSSFANFRFHPLPDGGGDISGIITKTFTGSNIVLVLNSLRDVDLTRERCVPLDINDFELLFEENFDEGKDNSTFDFPDWLNIADQGRELWTEQIFGSNGYAEFSGFRTNDPLNIGWLVSPKFSKTGNVDLYLNFKNAQHHIESDENILQLLMSTDFDGSNLHAANWQELQANLSHLNDIWYVFKDAGLVDLSNISGDFYIAFRYEGSGLDSKLDGAYMIDDFRILKPK